jgi:hypothetical protein
MLSEIKQNLSRNLSNLPGWRTNRHIIVMESDDWGSIRMSIRTILIVMTHWKVMQIWKC